MRDCSHGRVSNGNRGVRATPLQRVKATAVVAAATLLGAGASMALAPAQPAWAGASQSQLAQARKALLVLSDMPAGWVKTKSDNSSNNVGNAELARCLGVSLALVNESPPSVNSPQFQNRQGTLMVNDTVTVFPSKKNAEAELAIASNPKMPHCMTQVASGPLKDKLFGKIPKGTSIGTPLVSPTAASAFGATVPGYSLSVPVTSGGQTVNVTVTQLYAIKGVLGQQVTFNSAGSPFSVAAEQRVMSEAVGRL
jgi:hypothetical protein